MGIFEKVIWPELRIGLLKEIDTIECFGLPRQYGSIVGVIKDFALKLAKNFFSFISVLQLNSTLFRHVMSLKIQINTLINSKFWQEMKNQYFLDLDPGIEMQWVYEWEKNMFLRHNSN